ncbi:hypothetical protein PCASD_25466 [Puccinia coronata f. sp. avenae]|uniref:Uncharacterized protein n=1 Tax=Puccinia coronata f. sp. avenae TaxID=200324 RepID=A0A2N5RZU9_9BASI|nr:hypothetical protein PCASD_25466 [Puccinia coronata f. sp. avenae]
MADLEIPSFKNYRDNKSPDSSASSIHPFSNREFNQPNPPNTPEPEQKSFHQNYQNFYQQPPPPNPTTHFLDRVIQLPAYNPTPFGRRVIKIKPTKKDLFFDGTNMDILDFIAELENAAVQDGAQAEDIATQISSFIRDQNLLKEIRDITGKINNDWELLKYQMVQRWGKMMPLMKYTRESLDNLIYKARTEGGIKTLKVFQDFSTKLDTIVNYLVRCRHMASVEEIRHSVLNCLTPELRLSVNKELIRDNQMNLAIDGSYLLPPYQVIIKYIHKELKTLSILQMEEEAFSKEVQEKNVSQRSAVSKAPSPEKAIEEITKTLASWNVQKKPSTFYQSSHVPYTPAQNTRPPESFFCHYCHLKGHSTGRCNLANHDEIEGLIKREGGQIKLPDGSVVPFERSRPFKTAVDRYYAKSSQPGIIKIPPGTQIQQETEIAPEVHSSLGILEELEPSFGSNFELDTLEEFNPEVPPRTQCVSCNFTINCPEDGPHSQKEIMNQLGQKNRIKILEEVSLSENLPVMLNKDNLNLQQSIHESPIPTEVLVEEDNRFESVFESSKEIHLLDKNPILILPEEKKIPEKFSPMDKFHQNPKNTPHEWPHSEEEKKIKEIETPTFF